MLHIIKKIKYNLYAHKRDATRLLIVSINFGIAFAVFSIFPSGSLFGSTLLIIFNDILTRLLCNLVNPSLIEIKVSLIGPISTKSTIIVKVSVWLTRLLASEV